MSSLAEQPAEADDEGHNAPQDPSGGQEQQQQEEQEEQPGGHLGEDDHEQQQEVNVSLVSQKYGGACCAAVTCHNSQYRNNPCGVKFYRFPKDEERRRQWVTNLKRKAKDRSLWNPPSST
jgi:hypothetical protein